MGRAKVVALVAGEASGDALGALAMRALKRLGPVRFIGIGGQEMQKEGLESLMPMESIMVSGLLEVARHIPRLFALRRRLAKSLQEASPSLFVGIDLPDFNLGLEGAMKKAGIPVAHMVAPTVWAWRPSRMRPFCQAVDKMLVLFPFEESLWAEKGVRARFIGHPLASGRLRETQEEARKALGMESGPVVAFLPGSRPREVARLAPVYADTARRLQGVMPGIRCVAGLACANTKKIFAQDAADIVGFVGQTPSVIAAADVVLACSGTATLEVALSKKPMVICYRLSPMSFWLLRRLVRIAWAGLPNILLQRQVAPEYLQDRANSRDLAEALLALLQNPALAQNQIRAYAELESMLSCQSEEVIASALKEYVLENPPRG